VDDGEGGADSTDPIITGVALDDEEGRRMIRWQMRVENLNYG
jgi:hypothetical protein